MRAHASVLCNRNYRLPMKDAECAGFLQEALPRLGLRWPGFRKVRGLVCKPIGKRLRERGLADLCDYRAYLEAHASEWERLDAFCRIPISRLYRDRAVFAGLEHEVLPVLAMAKLPQPLRCALEPHKDFARLPAPGLDDWLSNHASVGFREEHTWLRRRQ